MKRSSNFFVFIEVELNVGASSHVTRVQNTLRTEIKSLIGLQSWFDEIGRYQSSNLYNNFLNLSHVMGPSPARAGLKRQFCKGAAMKQDVPSPSLNLFTSMSSVKLSEWFEALQEAKKVGNEFKTPAKQHPKYGKWFQK